MITLFALGQRFVGQITEIPGAHDHPLIQWWLSLCHLPEDSHDEVPWCSAFVNGLAWILRLPRSGSAAARSWLDVGEVVALTKAEVGYDVVVLKREGAGPFAGHVGLFAGMEAGSVMVLAGNQGNTVSVKPFPVSAVLGVRRLA